MRARFSISHASPCPVSRSGEQTTRRCFAQPSTARDRRRWPPPRPARLFDRRARDTWHASSSRGAPVPLAGGPRALHGRRLSASPPRESSLGQRAAEVRRPSKSAAADRARERPDALRAPAGLLGPRPDPLDAARRSARDTRGVGCVSNAARRFVSPSSPRVPRDRDPPGWKTKRRCW